jgi:hypothetical protein
MNMRSTEPFGRRGRAPTLAARPMQHAGAPKRLVQQTAAVRPEIVAAMLQPQAAEEALSAVRTGEIVPRSFRAAILAGFIVAILNAAVNATFAAQAKDGLGGVSLGSATAPIVAGLLIAALWSSAQTSTFCILVAHRLLAAMGRTSLMAYAVAGGVAAVVLAGLMYLLGGTSGPGGVGMEILSGMGAGVFYRFFAGTRRQDP